MLSSTKGIVLHHVKYGESSVIATIYTEKFGRQSYIINSARSRKSKNKASLLQPLFLLDLVTYQKENREVQRLKEFKPYVTFQTIPFDIRKSSQAIFIAEILYKILQEEEGNQTMFNFLENTILNFDIIDEAINNFHLCFLARLTKFLGISPHSDGQITNCWLDMKTGTTQHFEPNHSNYMNIEETDIFFKLSGTEFNDISKIQIGKHLRGNLLKKIIDYYQLHFETFGKIKSLAVLKETFE